MASTKLHGHSDLAQGKEAKDMVKHSTVSDVESCRMQGTAAAVANTGNLGLERSGLPSEAASSLAARHCCLQSGSVFQTHLSSNTDASVSTTRLSRITEPPRGLARAGV